MRSVATNIVNHPLNIFLATLFGYVCSAPPGRVPLTFFGLVRVMSSPERVVTHTSLSPMIIQHTKSIFQNERFTRNHCWDLRFHYIGARHCVKPNNLIQVSHTWSIKSGITGWCARTVPTSSIFLSIGKIIVKKMTATTTTTTQPTPARPHPPAAGHTHQRTHHSPPQRHPSRQRRHYP